MFPAIRHLFAPIRRLFPAIRHPFSANMGNATPVTSQ